MKKTKLKHRTRKFISFALAVCLLTGMLSVTASALTQNEDGYAGLYNKVPSSNGSGYTYRFLSENTIAITDYNGYDTEVTIPSKIDGYTVTGVEYMDTSNVRKIVMPDTVTYIGESAFADSSDGVPLEEVVLSKNLKTIGPWAFSGCFELKSIDIPESVTEIENGAFSGCYSLENFNVSKNTDFGENVFGENFWSSMNALSDDYNTWLYDDNASDFFVWNGCLFAYRGSSKTPIIPSGVCGIGDKVFENSDITGVTIPEGVRYINNGAFKECTSLKSVKFPNSLKRIGSVAFSGCTSLSSVTFGSGLKSIEYYGFSDCESLKKVVLPEGLEKLDGAFYECYNLENITFPSSLSEIDPERSAIYDTKWYENIADSAPIYCGGIFLGFKVGYNTPYKNIKINSTYTVRAGTKTVYMNECYVDKLTTLNLPDGLKSLTIKSPRNNVNGNYKITKLTVPESVDYVDIEGMSDLKTLKLPTTAKLGAGCFNYCTEIENLTIPKGNIRLEASLSHCVKLKSITLPSDTMEVDGTIGSKNLTSVNLSNVRILRDGFNSCTGLTKVNLPDSLLSIEGAFSGCTNLTTVTGGKNVRYLDSGFSACPKLKSFGSIGENLSVLEHNSFKGTAWYNSQKDGVVYFKNFAYCYKGTMPKNTQLTFKEGTKAIVGGFIFGDLELTPREVANFEPPVLTKVVIPKSCQYIGYYAFYGCESLKNITLNGGELVERDAFQNNGCETITLPSTMRVVDDESFTGKNLKTVNLNDGLQYIGEGAFFSMGKIKNMTVPASVTYIGVQAIGYYPPDPDNPFVLSEVIPNFVIYGTSGTEAQTYADRNGIQFNSIASGTTVKGTAKSYLSTDDTVTIQLEKSGVVVYETTVKGNSTDYSISDVANGTYTMRVSKKSHADREYTVKVSSADVTQNVEIFPIGDVNSDGDISVVDATLVQKYIVGLEKLTDLQKKSAEVNGDGEISVVDATLIQKYIVGLENFS
jgi:hypothetical protein